MNIYLKHIIAYGNHRYYPDCELSKMLCELLNRKSLTQEQVELIEKHGYKVLPDEK